LSSRPAKHSARSHTLPTQPIRISPRWNGVGPPHRCERDVVELADAAKAATCGHASPTRPRSSVRRALWGREHVRRAVGSLDRPGEEAVYTDPIAASSNAGAFSLIVPVVSRSTATASAGRASIQKRSATRGIVRVSASTACRTVR
jgi:hypothetical protein